MHSLIVLPINPTTTLHQSKRFLNEITSLISYKVSVPDIASSNEY